MSKASRRRQKERQKLKKVNARGNSHGFDHADPTPYQAHNMWMEREWVEELGGAFDYDEYFGL